MENHQSLQDENSNNDTGLTHRAVAGPNEFAEDFTCAVCLQLAVQPTSLICGHTFCRLCLARWYFTSGAKQCPMCHQAYQGHPKINIHIQNTIAKLCPHQLKEREQAIGMSKENTEILRKFNEDPDYNRSTKRKHVKAFCLGIAFAICAFLITYLIWYWQFSRRDLLVSKPVQFWRPSDVKIWLEQVPMAFMNSNKSIENNIDGTMLLDLDDESLLRIFNVSDPEHQQLFLSQVALLKEQGIQIPSTIWEYKDLFPGRCIFLSYGLRQFPRATILYTWLYLHDDVFLPFVKATTKSSDDTDTIETTQWINFMFYALLSPQWLVIVAANKLLSHQLYTWLAIITNAVLIEILEILWIISYFRNNNLEERDRIQIVLHYGGHLIFGFMLMVIWPVFPQCVCDLLFFIALYIRPFILCKIIYRKLIQ